MSTGFTLPPELTGAGFGNWLMNPTQLTEEEMAILAWDVFSQGNGLRWLEGLMWKLMFSTPMDVHESLTMRDVGRQDAVRIILAQVHQGLAIRQARSEGRDNGRRVDFSDYDGSGGG